MARRLKLGDIEEAEVVDLAHDGRGVARADGKAVFIEGALPGERVRFRVFKRRRQMDEAGLVDVVMPAAERVPAQVRALRHLWRLRVATPGAGGAIGGQGTAAARESGTHRPSTA